MILHSSLQSILTWLELPREIADCYQVLGLSFGASFAEIQTSYQRLIQQYEPNNNSIDQQAKDKFIAINEAYKRLTSVVQPPQANDELDYFPSSEGKNIETAGNQETIQNGLLLSEFEQQLKWLSYHKLQQFLKYQQFPKAIALVEGLAQRLPHDPQVSEWQASAYQKWGRQLLKVKQLKKARIYLRKALKTDPHNRDLWFEVEQDFRFLEQIFETRDCQG